MLALVIRVVLKRSCSRNGSEAVVKRAPMARYEWAELFFNRFITHIPHNPLRIRALTLLGAELGPHVYLFGGSEVIGARRLHIAGNCHVGRYCQVDARGGIRIGTNVVIASHTVLITAYHDVNDPTFPGRLGSITIEDRVWLATRVTVTSGVTIGEGAVAAAGSVIARDVRPWSVVAGVPARVVAERNPDQLYQIDFGPTYY
jgi:putative colanic acid biosynthesis acetyltransferase WcaF